MSDLERATQLKREHQYKQLGNKFTWEIEEHF